jgi:hypothetical protein
MMNLKSFFIVHSIIALIFGLAFVLVPVQVVTLYGGDLTAAGILMSRLFGSALLTYATVLWLARDARDSTARQAILLGFFVTMIVAAIVALHAQITGAVNVLGWSTVALYAALAVCYGYFVFRQRAEARQ